jgi:heme A synthase
VLGINLLVILWGAFVRASGSGAGCGAHWPLCNGQIVPQAPATATLIELTHRVTSGLALLAVVGMAVWAWRRLPARHPARVPAYASLFFIISEALVGAGLVLFEMVAHNKSVARGWWMSAHLTNTFLLIAALACTAWFAGGAPRARVRGSGGVGLACAGILGLALFVGISGAIAALGDTLFPVDSLRAGVAQDLDPSSHLFLRLRLLHPALAITFAIVAAMAPRLIAKRINDDTTRTLALGVLAVVVVQLFAGFANLLLLAPIWMQLLHLLLADAAWIALVLFSAAALAAPRPPTASARTRA